jgi:adenosylmethionine-8-amino-7-oxononanoate aminotransferase
MCRQCNSPPNWQAWLRVRVIISRINAYHGSTMASASLGGMSGMHAQGDLPVPNITHIEQPYFFDNGLPGETADEFGLRAAGWLEQKTLALGPDQVAAFIAEPVQGAGGVIIPPATYWREIQRVVDKYGLLLISDEVICAVGLAKTCGFMAGLVLVKTKAPVQRFTEAQGVGMICRGYSFERGLIMRAVGDRMILAPPLVMTHSQTDEMVALIVKCLDLTYQEVRRRGWLA